MLQRKQTTAVTANPCSAMESGNHSKNGASLKSLMSRGKLWTIVSALFLAVIMGACKGGGDDYDDVEPEFKTLLAPTGVTVTQVPEGIKVSWNPVEGAHYYDLEYEGRYFTTYWGTLLPKWYTGSEERIEDCYFIFVPYVNTDSCSFKVRATSVAYYSIDSDWSETVSFVYTEPGGGAATGLYMGILGFNEELNEKKISLLTDYKNTYNTNYFTSFVNDMQMKPATGLYYAVDNAIKRLEIAELPDDLENVSIITFTDGLDNVSIDLNTDYQSRDAYRDAVKKSLANTKIKNLPINAYSIGMRGSDVNDIEAFRAGLTAMASDQDKVKEVTNMDEVNETFKELATSLYNENQSKTVKLKITGGYDNGTKIRFTWDDVADAAYSEYYIEGTYKRNGTTRTLEDVVYYGINSTSGNTITGDVSGVYVTFTFKDF